MARPGRPSEPIVLTDDERSALEALTRSRTKPHGLVRRAGIVLALADGHTHREIASRLGISQQAVGHWRKRFRAYRLAGLDDAPKSGRPRTHDDAKVAEVINAALLTPPPDGATHWSIRAMEKHVPGVSRSSVQRWFKLFGVKPHRKKSFRLSDDPANA